MSQLKVKVSDYKNKENIYLVKAERAIKKTRNQQIYDDVLLMHGKWINNAIPAYLYVCLTNEYGLFENPYSSVEINNTSNLNYGINIFASEKHEDSLYEHLFGLLLKGADGYSKTSYGNLEELNASVTVEDWNRSAVYLSKAASMYPYFNVYLKKILPKCKDNVQSLITKVINDDMVIFSQYFRYLNFCNTSKSSLPKSLIGTSVDLNFKEKVLVALISKQLDVSKLSQKAKDETNKVLFNLLNIRPDAAIYFIDPVFFLDGDDNVKKKYIDILFTKPEKILDGKRNFLNNDFLDNKNYILDVAIPKSLSNLKEFNDYEKFAKFAAKLLIAVRDFDSKNLPVTVKNIKNFCEKSVQYNKKVPFSKVLEILANNLSNLDGGLKKDFIEIYRNTDLLKKELFNIKDVPNHLKTEAYFFGDKSKKELLESFSHKIKVADITKQMSSSVDFWKDYFSVLQTSSKYSIEIAKKLKNIKSNDREREVVDVLLESPNPISAVYLLTSGFTTVRKEEIDENMFNKVKSCPELLFSVPNESVKSVESYICVDAMRNFSSLSQKENALALINKYPLNKSDKNELDELVKDTLIEGYMNILSKEQKTVSRKFK